MDRDKLHSIFLLIILSVIWGSSFILIKKGLIGYTPAQVGALREFIAALVFTPYLLRNFRKINLKTYAYIVLFGLLEIGIPPYLYAYAQTVVDSSTAGILNSLVPLFTLLTGFVIFRVAVNSYKVIGVMIGLLGAVLLIFFQTANFNSFHFDNSWALLIVLATLFYGLGGNILKEHLQGISDIQITALAFVSVGIPSTVYLFSTDFLYLTFNDPLPISDPNSILASFFSIAILAVVGSAFAIVLFSKIVRKSSALFASFVTYLIPFVALLWGFIDGEVITMMQLICMLLILAGIYTANHGIRKNNKAD